MKVLGYLLVASVIFAPVAFALDEVTATFTVNPNVRTQYYIDGRAVIPTTEEVVDRLDDVFRSPSIDKVTCLAKIRNVGGGNYSSAVYSVRNCR